MFKEQEQPPTRTEYTDEEKKLFDAFETQLDDCVAPYLAGSGDFGNFRCAMRRNVVYLKKGKRTDPINPTLWQFHWEDNERSTQVVSIGYDIDRKSFYTFRGSEEHLLPTIADAVTEVRAKLEAMCAYFEKK